MQLNLIVRRLAGGKAEDFDSALHRQLGHPTTSPACGLLLRYVDSADLLLSSLHYGSVGSRTVGL